MSVNPVPPFGKHPKPKSKGVRKKSKGIKPKPEVKAMNVFKTAMESDAGADTTSQSKEAFESMLESMSEAEMGHLERLVFKIQKETLGKKGKENATSKRLKEAIEEKRILSAKQDAELRGDIKEKIQHFAPEVSEWKSNGDPKRVTVEGKQISIKRFITKYFFLEIERVSDLFEQGVLTKKRKGQRPENYIRRIVDNLLIDSDH